MCMWLSFGSARCGLMLFGSAVVHRWFSLCWPDVIVFSFGGLACCGRLLCGSVCIQLVVAGLSWVQFGSCVGSVVGGLSLFGSALVQLLVACVCWWFKFASVVVQSVGPDC